MFRFLAHRLLNMIPLLLGITLICFIVVQLAPGEPVGMSTSMDPKVSAAALEKMRAHYQLDKPITTQYFNWLKNFIQLDFGHSFAPDGQPVMAKVLDRLPVTLWMNIIGLLVVLAVAIPIGVASARAQNSWLDRSLTVLVFVGFAAPGFWIALLAMIYFGVELGWIPISGMASFGSEDWPFWQRVLDWAHHLAAPILIGVMGSLAGLSRYMRSSLLDEVRQDYITTARAKGVSETKVFYHHALRNALLPVITILGLSLPGLIGGSVIFESLFSIPGMGKLFYESVMMRDYPVIMGVLTIGALLTLLGNLLADIGYALADPRIRYAEGNS